jgi:L-rhamnose mutarotase
MTTIPMCVACGVKRRSIYIEPANDLFDFWSYRCPKCEAVVKVVKSHEARSEFSFNRAASASASFWVPSEASVAPSTPHVS